MCLINSKLLLDDAMHAGTSSANFCGCSGAVISARAFATGLVPTSVPLAPLLSSVLFFFPFAGQNLDGVDASKYKLDALKKHASKTIKFAGDSERVCRCCGCC